MPPPRKLMFFRSFRARLSWFFVIIVILPIVMVTVVLFRLVSDSETGRVDARLAQAQTSAANLYSATQERAAAAARRLAESRDLAEAIASGEETRIRLTLVRALSPASAVAATLRLADGSVLRAGGPDVVAAARTSLGDDGQLDTAVTSADGFATAVRELTGVDVIVEAPDQPIAGTLPAARQADLPDQGEVTVGDRDYRVTSFTAPNLEDRLRITLLVDAKDSGADAGDDRLALVALLLAFILLAFVFGAAVSRSLQAQIARLLQAARRLGRGDLDAEVPTEGDDEFAALGSEFNHMARQLKGRMDELESERERLQTAIRRTGDSIVATGTDRAALIRIVVQSAVDGVAASVGRASVRETPTGPLQRQATVGDLDGLADVLDAAEDEVLETHESSEVASATATPCRTRCTSPTTGQRSSASFRWRAPAARSPRPTATSSTTSPARRRCRSRTSACRRRSSVRRSPTGSRACSTTVASRRS